MEHKPVIAGTNQEEIRNDKGQFKPGISGNPAGKPRGLRPLSSLLAEALRKKVPGKDYTYEDKLIERVMERAISKGEFKYADMVFDRIEGKAPQTITVTNETDLNPETREKIDKAVEDYLSKK